MPSENAEDKERSFGMMVRGLFFLFRITNTQPGWHARLSMINSAYEWITVWNCKERGVWSVG